MAAHVICSRAAWFTRKIPISASVFKVQNIRTLLSDAYYCNETWQHRNVLPCSIGELTQKIEGKFTSKEAHKHPVASVDIDTYINHIENIDQLNQAKDFLYKYRRSPVAFYFKSYTANTWVRACLQLDALDEAITTVQDKVHYGLFPDNYTFNLLLDSYLRNEDYQNAAKVAMEMMTQEVLSPTQRLSQLLALYACHQYMKSHATMEDDINKQLGMTLIDCTLGQDSTIARTVCLIGHTMVGDIDKTCKIIKTFLSMNSTSCVLTEAIDRVTETFLKQQQQNESEEDSVIIYDVEGEIKTRDSLRELVRKLSEFSTSDEKLNDIIEPYITSQLSELEQTDIDSYPQLLEEYYQDAKNSVERLKNARETRLAEMRAKERKIWELMIGTPGRPLRPPVMTERDKQIITKQEKYIYVD
ncbi:small ribosomal subunit protein mS27-like [Saccoglossus kowalevskii]|uniref:28S ribosomal protein S27, mitochondrial-like n=1 Tax=Saccoglossus kowalevskii TaxID=10224 RepID=A0ABM0GKA0_SACKO|nr:PREDICTED: 28S ribosomal protein S27, mitochondrial-like [Saccoglossus kowalevskii]